MIEEKDEKIEAFEHAVMPFDLTGADIFEFVHQKSEEFIKLKFGRNIFFHFIFPPYLLRFAQSTVNVLVLSITLVSTPPIIS